MSLEQLIFYGFSALLISAGLMTVTTRNPVRAALFLVLAFFASVPLWLMLHAEFLALIFVLVYVGAVMTLFLFVVMMLNVSSEVSKQTFVRYLPFGTIIVAVLAGLMVYVLIPEHLTVYHFIKPASLGPDYSNTKELGSVLYTEHVLAFELAAVLLLVSIVAAITLAFRGRQGGRKEQRPSDQIKVKASERIRIVSMKSEKDNQ